MKKQGNTNSFSATELFVSQTLHNIANTLRYITPLSSNESKKMHQELKNLEAKLEFALEDGNISFYEILEARKMAYEYSGQTTLLSLINSDDTLSLEQKLVLGNCLIIYGNIRDCQNELFAKQSPSVEMDPETFEILDEKEAPELTKEEKLAIEFMEQWLSLADDMIKEILDLFYKKRIFTDDCKGLLPRLYKLNSILLQMLDINQNT